MPVGQAGELCARGYLVMRGYHHAPEATAAAIDAEGWYHTGDLASLDGRGYLRIEGRIKDMIIRGGENIYPREIEDALFAHPAVTEAVVVGVPDETWGEVVSAFVRPAPDQPAPSSQELRAWCRERLAPYKTPLHGVFVRLPDHAVRQDPEVQAARELHRAPTRVTEPAASSQQLACAVADQVMS